MSTFRKIEPATLRASYVSPFFRNVRALLRKNLSKFYHFLGKSAKPPFSRKWLCRTLFSFFFRNFQNFRKLSKKKWKKCSAKPLQSSAEHFFSLFFIFFKVFTNFSRSCTKVAQMLHKLCMHAQSLLPIRHDSVNNIEHVWLLLTKRCIPFRHIPTT